MKKYIIILLVVIPQLIIAQDSCGYIFIEKQVPSNFYLAKIKDSLNFNFTIKKLISNKKNYEFEFAFFDFTINKNGKIENLKLSPNALLSTEDKLFLHDFRDKLKTSVWYPAFYSKNNKKTFKKTNATLVFQVNTQNSKLEIYISDNLYNKELYAQDYSYPQ